MLLNKKILIRRINPEILKLVGDSILADNFIFVKFLWKTKQFHVSHIKQIRAYSLTDWGLTEYEQIDIILDGNYRIKFDASLNEHQNFIQSLLQQLGMSAKKLDWGFLPQHYDKMGNDLIFERNNIC